MHRRHIECKGSAMHTDDGSVLLCAAALIGEIRRELCPSMWFLCEETASLPPCTQSHIQRLMRCPPPLRLTSSIYSSVRCPRTRLYLTNLAQVTEDAPLERFAAVRATTRAWAAAFGAGQVPVPPWKARGELVKACNRSQLRCIMSETYAVARERLGEDGVPLEEWKKMWTAEVERKENNYNVTMDRNTRRVKAWTPQSAERVMGVRWHALGLVRLLPADVKTESRAVLPVDVTKPILLTRRLHNRALGRGLHCPTIRRLLQPLRATVDRSEEAALGRDELAFAAAHPLTVGAFAAPKQSAKGRDAVDLEALYPFTPDYPRGTAGFASTDKSLLPPTLEVLPEGWKTTTKVRYSGRSKGTSDTTWHSPDGKRFRSKVGVARYLLQIQSQSEG